MEELLRSLSKEVSDLSSVFVTNIGIEVHTPVYFPNGDTAVAVVSELGDNFDVHDSGAAFAFLNQNGVIVSPNLHKKIGTILANYGCVFEQNRVARKATFSDVAIVATIVSNASKAVAELVLHQHKIPIIDYKRHVLSKVVDYLGAKRLRLDEEVRGESGFAYHISAVVLDSNGNKVVGYVEPVKDHEAATKKFRSFWDISRSPENSNVRRVSLVDDTRKWDNSDLFILQEVSNVVRLTDVRVGLTKIFMN